MNFESLSEDEQKIFRDMRVGIERSLDVTKPEIESLSKKSLQKTLKVLAGLHEGEHILYSKETMLHPEEEHLLNLLSNAQEKILSFKVFMKEINDKYEPQQQGENYELEEQCSTSE